MDGNSDRRRHEVLVLFPTPSCINRGYRWLADPSGGAVDKPTLTALALRSAVMPR